MSKEVYESCIDFIYSFLELRMTYFGYSLSFMDILCGSFLLGLAIYIFFRITD